MENTYWNLKGKYQKLSDLLGVLIPDTGSVLEPRKNHKLEKFRKATNCYYDLYNNGLSNRANEFRQVFGIPSSQYKIWSNSGRVGWFNDEMFKMVEAKIDQLVLEAAMEQKLIPKMDQEQLLKFAKAAFEL